MMIVADSTGLIHFAQIGRLDLLGNVLSRVIIPEAVYYEVVIQGLNWAGSQEIKDVSWIDVMKVKTKPGLPSGLGQGEQDAISLSLVRKLPLYCDDRDAIHVAQSLGVETTSSLAILEKAKQKGFIKKARPILIELIGSGFWISKAVYEPWLRSIGE